MWYNEQPAVCQDRRNCPGEQLHSYVSLRSFGQGFAGVFLSRAAGCMKVPSTFRTMRSSLHCLERDWYLHAPCCSLQKCTCKVSSLKFLLFIIWLLSVSCRCEHCCILAMLCYASGAAQITQVNCTFCHSFSKTHVRALLLHVQLWAALSTFVSGFRATSCNLALHYARSCALHDHN